LRGSATYEWEHRAFVYEEVVEVLKRNSIGSITHRKRIKKATALICGVREKACRHKLGRILTPLSIRRTLGESQVH
jgi:hypothetical protein